MNSAVIWPQGKFTSAKAAVMQGQSMAERFTKAAETQKEQEKAEELLKKAHGPMNELLKVRLLERTPLKVVRDFAYRASAMENEEEDDGFYQIKKSESIGKFKDVRKVCTAGTVLMFKSLDMGLREFIFKDQTNKEHAISFDDKNLLLTNTSIYQDVCKFMNPGA